MVGQNKIKEQVEYWASTNTLPTTLMITGAVGSGKRTLAEYIAEKMGFEVRWIGNKVDDIRTMIVDSKSVSRKTMFVIVGADDMSLSAKNSLLKVTEEPPADSYFVLPLEDEQNTLPTIRSRSIRLAMEPYTDEELGQFTDSDLIVELATNPGEVKELEKLGVDNLVENVDKVVDNVYDVSTGNSLKIAAQIKFKDEEEGYPLAVFWRVFVHELVRIMKDEVVDMKMAELQRFSSWVNITQRYINLCSSVSLNKRMLFDMWLFDIRQEVK